MKYSECNAREQKAWKNIDRAASWHIFGLLNGCLDDAESFEDYKAALEDLNGLVDVVYNEAITNIYTGCGLYFGKDAESIMKDIRFCGKDFLMKVATYYCKKYQAEALAEIC